jgi:hypothetical protein
MARPSLSAHWKRPLNHTDEMPPERPETHCPDGVEVERSEAGIPSVSSPVRKRVSKLSLPMSKSTDPRYTDDP